MLMMSDPAGNGPILCLRDDICMMFNLNARSRTISYVITYPVRKGDVWMRKVVPSYK